jgi:maltooligosyltrehalose trehalohydrolase
VPIVDRSTGGWGATAQWADDLHHALHVRLTGESQGYLVDSANDPNAVREALADVYVPRRVTGDPASEVPVGDLDRSRFVVALQNHDQVGNRADGARIDSLSSIDAQLAAATLILLGPMVPLLFQGEEWASSSPFPFFADFHGELARSVSDGRRQEFADHGWDEVIEPCSPETFALARLDWSEPAIAPHDRVIAHYRSLIHLRGANPDLWAGAPCDVAPPRSAEDPVVELRRGRFVVTVNLSDRPAHAAAGDLLPPWATTVVELPDPVPRSEP